MKHTTRSRPTAQDIQQLLYETSFTAALKRMIDNPPPNPAVHDCTRISASDLSKIRIHIQPIMQRFRCLLTAIHRGELKASADDIRRLKHGLFQQRQLLESFVDDYKRKTAGTSDRANPTLAEDRTLAVLGNSPASGASPPSRSDGAAEWTVPDPKPKTDI